MSASHQSSHESETVTSPNKNDTLPAVENETTTVISPPSPDEFIEVESETTETEDPSPNSLSQDSTINQVIRSISHLN